MKRVFIIAEAGVNHNGSLEIAKKMIDCAAQCEVDAIKFQTFQADSLVSPFAPKAEYQKKLTNHRETQLKMLKSYQLDKHAHRQLMKYCKKRKILFISSPFDLPSINLLNDLGLPILKIPSGEINNLPYLKKIGKLKKKLILSTGMASLEEIQTALKILIKAGTPKQLITVLHCNTAYPTPFGDVNLQAMLTMKERLKVKVGYSDHTLGIEIPIAAVALGAGVIEKHFTLDRTREGPDHKASLEPSELKKMVAAIRHVELALGTGIKKPSASEIKNLPVVRKSLVAASDINKGDIFQSENIAVKRPGTGITPMNLNKVLGLRAKRDFKKDELIEI